MKYDKQHGMCFMCFSGRLSQQVCACSYLVDLGLLIIWGFQEMEDFTFYGLRVYFTLSFFSTVYKRKEEKVDIENWKKKLRWLKTMYFIRHLYVNVHSPMLIYNIKHSPFLCFYQCSLKKGSNSQVTHYLFAGSQVSIHIGLKNYSSTPT